MVCHADAQFYCDLTVWGNHADLTIIWLCQAAELRFKRPSLQLSCVAGKLMTQHIWSCRQLGSFIKFELLCFGFLFHPWVAVLTFIWQIGTSLFSELCSSLCHQSCSNAPCCVKLLIMQSGTLLLWGSQRKCCLSNWLLLFCHSGGSMDGKMVCLPLCPEWNTVSQQLLDEVPLNFEQTFMVPRKWSLLTLVIPWLSL